jgi:glycosyltransferase involved in cell wall biosynthesis
MDKRGLSILTFNWHEPYIHMLAQTGHSFDVVEPSASGRFPQRWDLSVRPIPQNARIVAWESARDGLRANVYNLAVCHNFFDLALLCDFQTPAVLLFHNRLTGELALGGDTVSRDVYLSHVSPLARRAVKRLFVSSAKKEDWGFDGDVIPHGVDVSRFGPYAGNISRALRIGNRVKERAVMLGFDLQERIVEGKGDTLVGFNPSLAQSVRPACFGMFKSIVAAHRLYLNTTVSPYEDAYNLSMLEAMASGVPVISAAHPQSFIVNGVNGFISGDVDELRKRADDLFCDHALARSIGEEGRATVAELFPMSLFVSRWNRVFEENAHCAG